MKILFLLGLYPNVGGTEQATTTLANSFAARGAEVEIVSFKQGDMALLQQLDPKVKFHPLHWPPLSFRNYFAFKKIIKIFSPDYIINQWAWGLPCILLCRWAMSRTKCKLLSVFHLSPGQATKVEKLKYQLREQKNGVLKTFWMRSEYALLNFSYRLAFFFGWLFSSQCVLLSPRNIPEFQQYAFGVSDRKLTAIPNPITRCKDESLSQVVKTKQLLYVGRLERIQKRIERILEAWQLLADEFPQWNLVIMGDGPDAANYRQMAEEMKLPRIQFPGAGDPSLAYAQSELLLLTSEYESFGLVILEGMLYQVIPVVYGNYVAVHDIVSDQHDGIVVPPPFKLESYCQALRTLMANPQKREELRSNIPKKLEQFSLARITDQWDRLLTEDLRNK